MTLPTCRLWNLSGNALTALSAWSIFLVALLVFAVVVVMPATSIALGMNETTSGIIASGISAGVNSIGSPGAMASSLVVPRREAAATEANISKQFGVSPAFAPAIFAWGHVTSYSRILYDEDVHIKGPTVLEVKYPEETDSNTFTIIGIQAYDNDSDFNSESQIGNSDLKVLPIMGGIGYNATLIRFELATHRELNYKLIIHGVEV